MVGKHISSRTVWKITSDYQSSANSVLIIRPCEEILDGESIILKHACCFWMVREVIMTVEKQIKIDKSDEIGISSIPEVSVFIVSSISLCWSKVLLICAVEYVVSREPLVLFLLQLYVKRFLFGEIVDIIIINAWPDRTISDNIESGDD